MSEAYHEDGYLESDEDQALEDLIFSAGGFVVPSDDLRARVVESATQEDRVRRFASRAAVLTLAVLVFWGCMFPIAQSLGQLRHEWTAPSADEVESMAYSQPPLAQETDARVWSLVDVFSRERSLKLGGPH